MNFDPTGGPISLDPRQRAGGPDRRRPDPGLRKAAEAFEGILVQMLMKEMQNAQLDEGMFGGGAGSDIYQGLFNQELSSRLADGSPFGIADMLVDQWTRDRIDPSEVEERLRSLQEKEAAEKYENVIQEAPTGHIPEKPSGNIAISRDSHSSSKGRDR